MNLSTRRSNWSSRRMEGSGDGERAIDEGEADMTSLLAPKHLATAYVGSLRVILRSHRMHVCPKSTSGPNIIGQAPAITLMSS